jgi:hypothetical protein
MQTLIPRFLLSRPAVLASWIPGFTPGIRMQRDCKRRSSAGLRIGWAINVKTQPPLASGASWRRVAQPVNLASSRAKTT